MHNTDTTETERGTCDVTFLTVHAAAVRLGVTTRAIRARIKRGTLNAVKVDGARGAEWRVNLGAAIGDTVTGDAIPTTPPAHTDTRGAWVAERAALLDQIAWLHQHVTTQSEHISELTRLLDAEREARAAISARPLQALPVVESRPRRRWFRLWG